MKLVLGEGAVHRRLGHGALGAHHVPPVVLHGQLALLAGAEHGVKGDAHPGIFAPLVARPGAGHEVAILGGVLVGAEHGLAGAADIVALGEALAGEDGLQIGQVRLGHRAAVQHGAVNPRDHGHVLRPLHSSFDLDGGHAHGANLLEVLHQAVVLEAQGIAALFKAAEAVGHAAGLGALAAVAAAPADDRGEIALPRVAHAQRAVDEDLNLHGAVAADKGNFLPGKLPGQHHAGNAHLGGLQDALQRVDAHLGGGVDGDVGGDGLTKRNKPQVLDDEGVHPQLGGAADALGGLEHLPVGE